MLVARPAGSQMNLRAQAQFSNHLKLICPVQPYGQK